MENSKCILNVLNNSTFNNTAQILLSNLDYEELQHLLHALQDHPSFRELSQLIRGRIIVLLAQKNDRTIYYMFFQNIPLTQLKQQRGNLISTTYSKKELNSLLKSYRSLVRRGTEIYGEQFAQIKQSILEPTLALPPVKRQTIAPNCQTIYQITLAFQKLKVTSQQENSFVLNEKTAQYFEECLTFQIEMAYYSINSIVDDLQHSVELSYRFMVYRNTVLSFHTTCPFTDITRTMKLWTSRMTDQYARANQVYLKLLEIKPIQDKKYGLFNYDDLRQQSYMLDYVQSLVDQSVTENNVAFCGHSKQKFKGLYATLQNLIVEWVRTNKKEIEATVNIQQVQQTVQKWLDCGLKPSTLTKIINIFGEFVNYSGLDRQLCCRDDYFIQNCARINGLSLNDSSQVHLQCF